jgi:hypothetical protein
MRANHLTQRQDTHPLSPGYLERLPASLVDKVQAEQRFFDKNVPRGHALAVRESRHCDRDEIHQFQDWISEYVDAPASELEAALEEEYGFPFFWLSGGGNDWTLSLGSVSENH